MRDEAGPRKTACWNWREVQTEKQTGWKREAPTGPQQGERWGDSNSGLIYLWDGSNWVQLHTD